MRKKSNKKIIQLITASILAIMFVYSVVDITFADAEAPDISPNYTITVSENEAGEKNIKSEGNLFGNELWYPGLSKSGVIRIENQTNNKINLTGLGIDFQLLNYQPGLDPNIVKGSFLSSMKLTTKKAVFKVFDHTIFDEMSLSDVINDGNGIALNGLEQYNIGSNEHIDLQYTLHMEEATTEELEALEAKVDFLIYFE